MTKQKLIATLTDRNPDLSKEDVHLAVDVILDTIANGLAEGKRVEFRGFGSLRLRYRKPRQGRNPRTGTTVPVQGKYFPHFKPGRQLRQRVDRKSDALQ